MRLSSSFRFTPFQHRFRDVISIGTQKLTHRNGQILHLSTSCGTSIIGELSPLPGLHPESINQSMSCLEGFLNKLLRKEPSKEINLGNFKFQAPLFNLIDSEELIDDFTDLHSSARFALEMALLELLKKANPVIFEELFGSNNQTPVNALLIPDENTATDLNSLLNKWEREKIRTIKIKIGRRNGLEEIKLINEIIELSNGQLFLRLDGNRSFSTDQFVTYAKSLPLEHIEYFEEPIKDVWDWDTDPFLRTLPLALDESLPACLNKNSFPRGTRAFVLKPNLLGGFSIAAILIDMALKLGYYSVISSCFESQMGIQALTLLNRYQAPKKIVAAGLDTLQFFEES
jgi:o-succinylbenzoate synthase